MLTNTKITRLKPTSKLQRILDSDGFKGVPVQIAKLYRLMDMKSLRKYTETSLERARELMKKPKLVVKQLVPYKVTTKRKHSDAVADNLLNMNFNPVGINEVWAGDVTYLRTGQGWI